MKHPTCLDYHLRPWNKWKEVILRLVQEERKGLWGTQAWGCMSISKLLKHLIDVRSFSFSRVSHCPCQTWSYSTSPRETTTEISLPSGMNFHIISLFVILPQTTCRAKKYLGHWSHQDLCKDFKQLASQSWFYSAPPPRELQCFSHF